MKSGSWASFQSALPTEARAGGEPDDEPPTETWPKEIKPGRRYMAKMSPWRWDVYGWEAEGCNCIGSTRGEVGEPLPRPDCPACKGTGDDGCLVPVRIATDLIRQDALLLVHGDDMLDALHIAALWTQPVPGDCDEKREAHEKVTAAIARAEGGAK